MFNKKIKANMETLAERVEELEITVRDQDSLLQAVSGVLASILPKIHGVKSLLDVVKIVEDDAERKITGTAKKAGRKSKKNKMQQVSGENTKKSNNNKKSTK